MFSPLHRHGRRWLRRYGWLSKTEKPWCVFTNTNGRETATRALPVTERQQISAKPRRQRAAANRAQHPLQHIGPRTLDLFERIYEDTQAVSALKSQIVEYKQQLRRCQLSIDTLLCRKVCIEGDSRIYEEEVIELHSRGLAGWENDKSTMQDTLATCQNDAAKLDQTCRASWAKLCLDTNLYCDSCLEHDFQPDWSLDENACRTLNVTAQLHGLISQTLQEKRRLWIEVARLRNGGVTSATAAASTATPLHLPGETDTERRERIKQAADNLARQAKALDELSELRETSIEDSHLNFCEYAIKPLLEKAGRIEGPSRATAEGQDNNSPIHQDETGVPMHRMTEGNSSFANFTADELKERYVVLLQQLYEVQNTHDEKQANLRMLEVAHMCTFRQSNHNRFEQIVEKSVQAEAEAMGNIERDLVSIRRRLIELGDDVPRSPDGSLGSIRGGGLGRSPRRSGSSRSSRRTPPPERRFSPKRGRITRYRLKADEVPLGLDLPLEPPSSDKSIARLSSVRSRSHTYSRSPDSEFDQYLDKHREQYNKEREESFGKYGLPAVEDVPEG